MKHLPLPSIINPPTSNTMDDGTNTDNMMVLYTITATNGHKNKQPFTTSELTKMNTNANKNLWYAIQTRLLPPPTDVWPYWAHNSLAQYREDGFTLMYPYSKRSEVRLALVQLGKEFGQSFFYEFVPHSLGEDEIGSGVGSIRGAGGSVSSSDAMIRRTISTSPSSSSLATGENLSSSDSEPTVVMRRVKDLPVEDELTMREWEGPPLEDVVWKMKTKKMDII